VIPVTGQAGDISALWLRELGNVIKASQHDMRNVLQGIGVNLEVVRSRLERDEEVVKADRLRKYAVTASERFDQLTHCVDALLHLLDTGDEAFSVSRTVESLRSLLNAAGRVRLSMEPGVADMRSNSGELAGRLAVVHVVLCAVKTDRPVLCRASVELGGSLDVLIDSQTGYQVDEAVIQAVAAGMVGVRAVSSGIRISFPTRVSSDAVYA
jgi:hypothetical protein